MIGKKSSDIGKMVGTISVDFSKAFDSLPDLLLIANVWDRFQFL